MTEVIYSPGPEWVISTGQDKFLTWMCTQSGSLVGRYAFSAWASCLQYPLGPIVIYTIPPTLYKLSVRKVKEVSMDYECTDYCTCSPLKLQVRLPQMTMNGVAVWAEQCTVMSNLNATVAARGA